MNLSKLPQPAQIYVTKNYKGKKEKETSKIVKSNGETACEVQLPGKELVFAANGNLKEVEKD